MIFGSVCSGIEAASVAWHPLGWRAAWVAEIEPFPSAVLAHHFPQVPNLGDMTQIAAWVRAGFVTAPDVLVGGTPCQAFSVAGARKSLDDDRGQLSLEFIRLADAIDEQRNGNESIIVWENVPGVLNTKDNAFGCFLAGLAGESRELEPTGGRWGNAGCVLGPQRAIAWRVLDAQHFGVAQRRRRVFVVASAREGFDPTKVLFEFDGVRRDTPPSRSAGQETAGSIGNGIADPSRAVGTLCARDIKGVGNQYVGEGKLVLPSDHHSGGTVSGKQIFPTLAASMGKKLWSGNQEAFSGDYFVCHGTQDPIIQPVDNNPKLYDAYQHHGWREGETCGTLTVGQNNTIRGDTPVVIHATQDNQAFPLGRNHGRENAVFGIPGNWIGRKPENGGNAVEPMDNIAPCQTKTDRHAVAYAFDSLSSNSMKSPNPNSGCREVDLAKTLDTTDPNPSKNQGGIGILQPQAFGIQGSMIGRSDTAGPQGSGVSDDVSFTLTRGDRHAVAHGLVRRLTPTECERLQGFPDGWTKIPYRNKPVDDCPDGPRYAALGNSMAVPVMAWIGKRIAKELNK